MVGEAVLKVLGLGRSGNIGFVVNDVGVFVEI